MCQFFLGFDHDELISFHESSGFVQDVLVYLYGLGSLAHILKRKCIFPSDLAITHKLVIGGNGETIHRPIVVGKRLLVLLHVGMALRHDRVQLLP